MYQSEPPRPPKEVLPTMYDLPSDKNPEEPGLDEFHLLQSQLLSETFAPSNYSPDEIFTAIDLNLYYDVHHPLRYKRPDWFAVVGHSRLYEQRDSRLSYVIWQEGVAPIVVVELISPGTEREDLGQTLRGSDRPATKWEVYEQILRVPYYIVYDRYRHEVQFFQLQGSHYVRATPVDLKFWIEDLQLGLGLWEGTYRGIERSWLRWYDAEGNWIPLERELTERERQRAERERQKAERLMAQLRSLGVEPETED